MSEEGTERFEECFERVDIAVPMGALILLSVVCFFSALYLYRKQRDMEEDRIQLCRDNLSRERVTQLEEENARINFELQETKKKLHDSQTRIERQLLEMGKQLDEALTRLSSAMSAQLRDGNAGIVDLGDKNRPDKLVDGFGELYDNQYTNAYEEVSGLCKEDFYENEDGLTKETVQLLLNILKHAFEACKRVAQNQLNTVQQLILCPQFDQAGEGSGPSSNSAGVISTEFMVQLKDQRKKTLPDLSMIEMEVEKYTSDQYSQTPFGKCLKCFPLKMYTSCCVEISWLMSIQDPPMHLVFDDRFNAKPFTRAGSKLQYFVWPTVYRCENGTFMKAGVAQFCD